MENYWLTHQINQARSYARMLGPGTVSVEKSTIMYVLTWANYTISLNSLIAYISTEKFQIEPNFWSWTVVKLWKCQMSCVQLHTWQWSINWQLCHVEKCELLSCSTLFKILDAWEASQSKSLQDLDNAAASWSAAFHMVEMIIDSLEKARLEKNGAHMRKESFRMLNATWRLVIMIIASQRKPRVPTTATNSPSVTNKIPIFMKSVLFYTQKLEVTVKIWKMFMMKKTFKLEALPGTARTNISLQLQAGLQKYVSLESSQHQINESKSSKARSVEDDSLQPRISTSYNGLGDEVYTTQISWEAVRLVWKERPERGTSLESFAVIQKKQVD